MFLPPAAFRRNRRQRLRQGTIVFRHKGVYQHQDGLCKVADPAPPNGRNKKPAHNTLIISGFILFLSG
jgi:hypothetical protein